MMKKIIPAILICALGGVVVLGSSLRLKGLLHGREGLVPRRR